uniref:Uncharacterized protein n=1 Tax=Physcomitrium patens TaxID=3218 RepID=A0A2K1L473_PHYPA|nr:hypothetical protein PHYPA_003606 [Physcomitrium patens]
MRRCYICSSRFCHFWSSIGDGSELVVKSSSSGGCDVFYWVLSLRGVVPYSFFSSALVLVAVEQRLVFPCGKRFGGADCQQLRSPNRLIIRSVFCPFGAWHRCWQSESRAVIFIVSVEHEPDLGSAIVKHSSIGFVFFFLKSGFA